MENGDVRNTPPSTVTGGGAESQQAPSSTMDLGFRILFVGAQVVGGILVLLLTIESVCYKGGFAWRSDPHLEFNWHPLLTTIGMIYLFGNGLLMFRFLRNMKKRSLNITHASLLFAAFMVALIGMIAAFDAKNFAVPPKENLRTFHSWLGIVTFVGFALQWMVGFVTYLKPGLTPHLRGAILPFHTYFGFLLFIMACVSAATGLAEKRRGPGYEGLLINQMGMILMLFAAIVIYLLMHIPYKRQPTPPDGYNLATQSSE